MSNKLKETEVQRTIRTTTSVIAALGQYFDPVSAEQAKEHLYFIGTTS